MKHFLAKILKYFLVYRDDSTYCPVCSSQGMSFSPLPDFYRENAEKYGYKYFGCGEMTALETYLCSVCGASDRERLYALWLDHEIKMGMIKKGINFIHFAPEHALSLKIKSLGYFDYQTADAMMEGVDYIVNLMNLPFNNNSFDFFICSHVLEHVEDDDLAISELFRITKKGGRGILMVPIIIGLEKTIEDPSVKTEEERWKYFGQNDHVRLYAHDDYVKKIKKHGFHLKELGVTYFGKRVFKRLGLKNTSVLYIVKKP
ncbi:class I SAM-dependent methyltransferase [Desulforudis sp. 1088]|uniref:class I SAM-dependent methyltransferase n=1 Tax=unclassified Candidatus Desulforudis TaxID=2635950 RepID=UPI003CE51C2B